MGSDIKSLRIRIRSVDSTLHLTKAMGLVAASKIRRATRTMNQSREYASAMGGLAGGYNANIFRLAATEPDAEFIPIGKRACERWGKPVVSSEKYPATEAKQLADELCRDFLAGKFGRLGILYTRYKSMMSQEATLLWVLPLEKNAEKAEGAGPVFEPNEQTVLNAAVPTYVSGLLSACVKESYACEVAARRMAMDSAGKNAQEMIDNLQLQYNRARQNSITQEITEIVAGSGL